MLPIRACENAVGPSKISAPQIIAALNEFLNNIASLLELPVSVRHDRAVFSGWRTGLAQSAVVLRTVKPPPHEVGGSSWLGVVLARFVGCWRLNELKPDRTFARV